MIIVRPATHDDLTFVSDASLQLGNETAWRDVNLLQTYGDGLARILELIDDDSILVAVAEDETHPVGCLIGEVVNHILIPQARYLYEHVLYVEPRYRRKRAGVRLWHYAKAWAQARGADRGIYGKPKLDNTTKSVVKTTIN